MIKVPRILLVLTFIVIVSYLKSQETIIKVPFSQPKKLILDAGKNQELPAGQSLMLGTDVKISGGSPEYLYSWKDSRDNEYSTPVITVSETGSYYLTVTDENHCTAVDSVYVSQPTSISEDQTTSGYSLFPNPSAGLVYFTLKNPGNRFKIEVVSRDGRIVFQQKFEASGPDVAGVIDLTDFDKGVYFVKLITADGSSTKSIIIH
jgi:hypothetical protein